jgi:hypothetical protein
MHPPNLHVYITAAELAASWLTSTALDPAPAKPMRGPLLPLCLPQVPCSPSMFSCAGTMVPTNKPRNTQAWSYMPIGGTVTITAAVMPVQAAIWSKLTELPTDARAQLFLMATHSCAYSCYTSQFTGDADNACLLQAASNGTAAGSSYCSGFPTVPAYP